MLEVKGVAVADLIPYVNNSRTHSDEQVTQVAASIREFGFTNPILIDDEGTIIAGHGRLMAAKKLNMEEVPCITLCGLTEAQKKAYVIADNQLALNAGWDVDMLKLEIETLDEMDFDVGLLGFDGDFLDLGEDIFDGGEDDGDDEKEPTKTVEGYAEFAVVMQVENKQRLVSVLNSIKAKHEIESQEDAIMILLECYPDD